MARLKIRFDRSTYSVNCIFLLLPNIPGRNAFYKKGVFDFA